MGWRAWRAGTGRRAARIFTRSRSIACWSRRWRAPAYRGSTTAAGSTVLLHDAPEYVIGDMISPFKAVIGDAYKAVERRLLTAIHLRFGLPAKSAPELEALIKAADRQAAYLEATRLAGFEAAEARRFFGRPPVFSAAMERDYLKPWPAETAQARYVDRFKKLIGEGVTAGSKVTLAPPAISIIPSR